MHRAFVTERDYDSYESPERAAQRRQNDRKEELAAHAVHDSQKPERVGDDETRAINARFKIPDTYAKTVPERFRKGKVPVMDTGELSEGPNLPHRDDKGVSERSRDTVAKIGYYSAGTDAYSSDAYMGKDSPIDRKGRTGNYRNDRGETYVVPHGLHSSYRKTTDAKGKTQAPHQAGRWGKPHTARNKHLAYWRDPTATEALRNVRTNAPKPAHLALEVERGLLLMWVRLHDIMVRRGEITDGGRSAVIREIVDATRPGDMVTVDMYRSEDITRITNKAPKMYRKGEFGKFLKDLATQAKVEK